MSEVTTVRNLAHLYDQHLRTLAGHFSNMGSGRADSAALVASFFHELVDELDPNLFVEVGAYRADASRRVRNSHPECRVVAFEANPHNHGRYLSELGFAELGIEYLNLAVTDAPGPVTFHLRASADGQALRKTTGNSSLLRRSDSSATSYDEISVDGVALDSFFDEHGRTTAAAWIDVEGASGQVLRGGTDFLRDVQVLLIELEERPMWEKQWVSLDVTEFLLSNHMIPISRDIQFETQHNALFVSREYYERPETRRLLELHTNYITQHMGVSLFEASPSPPDRMNAMPAFVRRLMKRGR